MFERIVVGVTKEDTARDAATRASQLADRFGAELHIVTAFGDDAGAADRAEQMLESMKLSTVRPLKVHARPGDPAAAICEVAASVGSDLIVIGNKGLAKGSRWSKSVPGEVSRNAPCSVLILDTV